MSRWSSRLIVAGDHARAVDVAQQVSIRTELGSVLGIIEGFVHQLRKRIHAGRAPRPSNSPVALNLMSQRTS